MSPEDGGERTEAWLCVSTATKAQFLLRFMAAQGPQTDTPSSGVGGGKWRRKGNPQKWWAVKRWG